MPMRNTNSVLTLMKSVTATNSGSLMISAESKKAWTSSDGGWYLFARRIPRGNVPTSVAAVSIKKELFELNLVKFEFIMTHLSQV